MSSEPQTTEKLRVAKRGGMTAVELAKHMGVSVDQIERSLQRLLSKKLIAEIGSND